MGEHHKSIIHIFASQLFILVMIACGIGYLFGYGPQQIIALLLKDFFQTPLPSAEFFPLLSGFISGLITLFGFSLPSLLRLQSIPPLKVLRDDLTPLPLSLWFVYGLAITSIVGVMWWQSG